MKKFVVNFLLSLILIIPQLAFSYQEALSSQISDEDLRLINLNRTDYIKILNLLVKNPKEVEFLKPLNNDEKNALMALFEKNNIRIDSNSDIYKGDFRNNGSVMYEIITFPSGNDSVSTADFYQLHDNHFSPVSLPDIPDEHSEEVEGMGIAGAHVNYTLEPTPIAPFTKGGKFYLRYLRPLNALGRWYPDQGMGLGDVELDTYLWQTETLTQIKPNFQLMTQGTCSGIDNELKHALKGFSTDYAKHNYSKASKTMNDYLSMCKIYLDKETVLKMQNDLLITLVHLNDKNRCQTVMKNMQDEITRGGMADNLVKRANFNFKKCNLLK